MIEGLLEVEWRGMVEEVFLGFQMITMADLGSEFLEHWWGTAIQEIPKKKLSAYYALENSVMLEIGYLGSSVAFEVTEKI